jgi:hypothetical protein
MMVPLLRMPGLATYPFPSVKSCDLREVAHDDRRVSSAGSLHPEDVSLIGTTAGMASVAVQFDPERHLSLVALPPVRDLLLSAKYLLVHRHSDGSAQGQR